ncbi:hypothetical protein [Natrinema marinum]|uniref:hypothetical protein n=1 Tax=Natrinema marinum TaxID=2961598 RepID=UPI0020C8C82C|nr:hypothetical protein [Natrinema marinum]
MSADPWTEVRAARTAYHEVTERHAAARSVHAALSSLSDRITRGAVTSADVASVTDALERFGGPDDDRRRALSFVTAPVLEGDRDVITRFRSDHAVSTPVDTLATSLSSYVDGGDWSAVTAAMAAVVDPNGDGANSASSDDVTMATRLFGLVVEAATASRQAQVDRLQDALARAYDESGDTDPLSRLDEQPVALLPVRLETRFVDSAFDTDDVPDQLLVRVFPDQLHMNSHEPELTDEEVTWGENFWATVWYARHPDPSAVNLDPDGPYLTERLPSQRLREHVSSLDPALAGDDSDEPRKFSRNHARRYDELKERAWRQLVERFGRERGSYIVHALSPKDDDLAQDLLTKPPTGVLGLFDSPIATDGGDEGEEDTVDGDSAATDDTVGPASTASDTTVDASALSDAAGVDFSPLAEDGTIDLSSYVDEGVPNEDVIDTGAVAEAVSGTTLDERTAQEALEEAAGIGRFGRQQLPTAVPEVTFPDVARRPESWTKPPTAELLPDRFVVVASWEDDAGEDHRIAIAGDPIRDPLPTGPSPEAVGEDHVEADEDTPAPPGTEWMVDFREAERVGMGLRLDLEALSGFDPSRGFDRVTVVGAKASMDAAESAAALEELLDAHHYTDGLAFLEQGTPTNNFDGASGYTRSDEPATSVDVACAPALVESGDRSDGDLLARALSIDPDDGERHVFANVEGADRTEQRNARHANSALWPATLGYSLTHIFVGNRWLGNESVQGTQTEPVAPGERVSELDEPLLWLDACRRHFVRYVRGRGPFPTLRVGKQPYGVLPARAIETDLDVTIVEQDIVEGIVTGEMTIADAELRGTPLESLVGSGVRPKHLLSAGATPDDLLEAGVKPRQLVADGAAPAELLEAGAPPDAFLSRGVSPIDRTKLTHDTLEQAGVLPASLERAGLTPATLASGRATEAQLEEAGITPAAVAQAALPTELREAGVSPRAVAEADVTAKQLLDGEVSASDLEAIGVTTDALADALLPAELQQAGLTGESLSEAGVTVEALMSGEVDADDLIAAGLTPETLAESGLLPEQMAKVAHVASDLLEAGLKPTALLTGDIDIETLRIAGVTPDLLVEAGIAPKKLVDAGMDVVDVALHAESRFEDLVDAGATPAQLARAGVAVADVAGLNVPADELVRAGYTAQSLLQFGFSAMDVAQGGVRPSELRDLGVAASELHGVGKAAGSLRTAGYTAGELLEAGYAAEELVNGGFSPAELSAAGLDPETVRDVGRSVADLAAAGYTPEQLHGLGYSPQQLLDASYDAAVLLEAGYTAGELLDAGVPPSRLVECGVDVGALRAADVGPETLATAGADPTDLKEAGVSADRLLDAGLDPDTLAGAGFSMIELEVAGVDVDDLAADIVTGDATANDVGSAVLEGLRYAAPVLEDPEQAERDLYSFSFDPALPRVTAKTPPPGMRSGPDSSDGDDRDSDGTGTTDGGLDGFVIQRPQAIDDRLDHRIGRYLSGFRSLWSAAAADLPFAGETTEAELFDALSREGLSSDFRTTSVYSAEDEHTDDAVGVATDAYFGEQHRTAVADLLADLGLSDLDSRAAHLVPLTLSMVHDRLFQLGEDPWLPVLYEHIRGQSGTEPVERHDLVDTDLGRFVRALLDLPITDVAHLGTVEDPDRLPIDPTVLDVEPETWSGLETDEQRRRIVTGIEDADDAVRFVDTLLDGEAVSGDEADTDGKRKLILLARLQAEHGDSGALRSLARVLFQFGLQHEYLHGRLRLGQAYGDPPMVGPEPAYYGSSDVGLLETLREPVPDSLVGHPNVDPTDTYGDALSAAAANYQSTTSIDPRISEYTDSLRYLGALDRSKLADALSETLDLTNHRVDAWWTSLATKRLFELREAQGSYDPDAATGHDSWLEGAGDEGARATIDPGLLSSMSTPEGFTTAAVDGETDGGRDDESDSDDDPKVDDNSETTDDTTTTQDGSGDEPTFAPTSFTFSEDGIDESAMDSGTDAIDSDTTGRSRPTGTSVDRVGTGGPAFDASDVLDDATTGGSAARSLDEGSAVERLGVDADALAEHVRADPGIYVGAYGFVEDLSADPDTETPEYVHAPSQAHATTAALLRSGYRADEDADESPLATDLSADRVRDAMRLIRGVRRDQSLGELLGYRFERRLHEVTTGDDDAPNLMQYIGAFRAEFPALVDRVNRSDERQTDGKDDARRELATFDVVDGSRLLESWDEYPFGRDEFPQPESDAYSALDEVVSELATTLDATGDLLTAESVHQLAQGNFERTGGSLDALSKGAPIPDPDVVETPRSTTGVTHRQFVVLSPETIAADAPPRSAAEPTLAAWVDDQLPDLAAVECRVEYRWPATDETAESEERASPTMREATTTLSLDALTLGPLDVLELFGAEADEARTELESRLAYHAVRDRPTDPAVPLDADIHVALRETATDGAVAAAELLELARSLRTLVQDTRPATAADLSHPHETDANREGYDDTTAAALVGRAETAQDDLYDLLAAVDERLTLLDPEHTRGDGLAGVTDPREPATTDGSGIGSGLEVPETPILPGRSIDAIDSGQVASPTVTEQADALYEAATAVADEVPFAAFESIAGALDGTNPRPDFETLRDAIPAGPTDPDAARESLLVGNGAQERVSGTLTETIEVPDPEDETTDDDTTGGAPSDSDPLAAASIETLATDISAVAPEQFEIDENDATDAGAESESGVTADALSTVDPDALTSEQLDALPLDRETLRSVVDATSSAGDDTEAGAEPASGPQARDWSDETVAVRAVGTDGDTAFVVTATTQATQRGSFEAELDFSALEPGTPFMLVALVDETIYFAERGRVIADATATVPDPQRTLRESCSTAKDLLWLDNYEDLLSVDGGAAGTLEAALETADWNALTTERDAIDIDETAVTAAERDAVDTLLALADASPSAVASAAEASLAALRKLGLATLFDVAGGATSPADASFRYVDRADAWAYRARLARALSNPVAFNTDVPVEALGYVPESALAVADRSDATAVANAANALVTAPAWVIRRLDTVVDAPHELLADLETWLYDRDTLERSPSSLATRLRTVADGCSTIPGLETAFASLGTRPREALATGLRGLAAAIEASTPAVPDVAAETATFDTAHADATTDLVDTLATERNRVAALTLEAAPRADYAFRKAVLERLRDPLASLAQYGVYGATPAAPDGGRPDDEAALVEQAGAAFVRARDRLREASTLDPRLEAALSTRPVPQRVEDQTDRLRALFGEGFTVVPSFVPQHGAELTATFDSDLVGDDPLAAETWLQRTARVRERTAQFRESRSYAETLTGTLAPDLAVGQLPHVPGEKWVGIPDEVPEPGRLSLLAQFGADDDPSVFGGRVAGLFVDEWVESVPAETETTGVALRYDDPGARAPQSVLLAVPPEDGDWSIGALASIVAETFEYAKLRSVDLGDVPEALHLLPGTYLPTHDGDRRTPSVDLGMLEWYDRRLVAMPMSPTQYLQSVETRFDGDFDAANDGGASQ